MSRKFFAFLCLLVIASSVASGQETGRKCVPGKSYFDGCNWCYCHKGGISRCTEVPCDLVKPESNTLNPPEEFWEKNA
ncbi:serine protease inhibitor 3-like [Ptiloglossa arizonensis]|uniref:serine protease inhibitor 3-like n=1 Tax=Ptiloglossa arizonensis TaxID=3350558 RepID=UPI003FA1317F